MNQELLIIHGVIFSLNPQDQEKVKALSEEIKALVAKHDGLGKIALGLASVEICMADEDGK